MLRHALHEIAPLHPEVQLQRLEELRDIYGHSVVPITNAQSDLRFNCVLYAYDVHEHAWLYQLLVILTFGPQKELGIHMDTGFITWLVNAGLMASAEPSEAALVVYYVDGEPTHIGQLVSPERVRSKWGNGHMYEHALLEVPDSYGDECRYFYAVDAEDVVDQFVAYAREKGADLANEEGDGE